MNSYEELKNRHHKEFNEFPLGAAFSNEQFERVMRGWGFTPNDTDKIISIGGGCFIRKSDREKFLEICERFKREEQEAIDADETGEGYIYEMFKCELADHEYGYTYELYETLEELGYTIQQIRADKRLKKGLEKALKPYYDYPYEV